MIQSQFEPIRRLALAQGSDFLAKLPPPTKKLLALTAEGSQTFVASLTDSQNIESQLRFFQKSRVFRLLRDLAIRIKEVDPGNAIELTFNAKSVVSEPIAYFIETCRRDLGLKVNLRPYIKLENIPCPDPYKNCLERLSTGDTWTCLDIWKKYGESFTRSERNRIPAMAYALRGEVELAETYLNLWLECATPANKAWALYSRAMFYARHHTAHKLSLKKAKEDLDNAYDILLSCEETDAITFSKVFNRNGFALVLFREGQTDRAIELLQDGISKLSNCEDRVLLHKSVLIYNLAQCYAAQSNLTAAKEAYLAVLNIDPHYAENRTEYAKVLIELGELEEATNQLYEATQLDSSLGTAWALLAQIYSRTDYRNAITPQKRAVLLEPENSQYKVDLAELHLGVEEYELSKQTALSLELDKLSVVEPDTWERAIQCIAESELNCKGAESAQNILKAAHAQVPRPIFLENLDELNAYA